MLELKKGYWIIQAKEVKDEDSMTAYANLWANLADKFQANIITATTEFQVVEGNGANRVLIVEFPSYEIAVHCYQSDEYQAAKQYALQAMDRSLMILEC